MSPTSHLPALNALPTPTFRAKLFPPNSTSSTFTLSTRTPHPTTDNINNDEKEPAPLPSYSYDYSLQVRASTELSAGEFEACFGLVRETSGADYGASSVGWRSGEKKREMRLRDLRYVLLVRAQEREQEQGGGGENSGEKVCGFLSFMLTWEDGVEVVYCYEIHLEECVRGKGVGGRLMGVLEEVGRRAGVQKAMLTVFRRNEGAVGFYEGLGYGVDEYSPKPKRLRNGVVKEVDYLILSKSLGGVDEEHGEGWRRRKRKAG